MSKKITSVTWYDVGTQSILSITQLSKLRLLSDTDLLGAGIPPVIIQRYRHKFTSSILADIATDLMLGKFKAPMSTERQAIVRSLIEDHLNVLK